MDTDSFSMTEEGDGTWCATEPRGIISGYGDTPERALNELMRELDVYDHAVEASWGDHRNEWEDD